MHRPITTENNLETYLDIGAISDAIFEQSQQS